MIDDLRPAGAVALWGFLVSGLAAFLLSRVSANASLGMDRETGVQKFHVRPTSRLGGVAIVLGVFAGVLISEDAVVRAGAARTGVY